jgi:hypothetical protein
MVFGMSLLNTLSTYLLILFVNYACTYYSTSQPKTIGKYFWTYVVSLGCTIFTSFSNN